MDVGCGIGTWLTEFKAAGISDYLGVDGDYVSREQLHHRCRAIRASRFVAAS